MMMASKGARLDRLSGMLYNVFTTRWSLTADTAVNYIAAFHKREAQPSASSAGPGYTAAV
jgi:2-polyprenyl-3-methyl-5-hydroxy-6-metoxy-1,4-benzoquinol methylase